jgi:WD40 repeat protein
MSSPRRSCQRGLDLDPALRVRGSGSASISGFGDDGTVDTSVWVGSAVPASKDGTLKVWDLESGRAEATLEGHAAWVTACAVTPDERRVVSASYDKTLRVSDL